MKKLLRWGGIALAVLVGIVVVAFAYIYFETGRVMARQVARPESLAAPSAAQLADASRQARILGCANCHGERLEGKTMMDQPMVGTILAPNLTQIAAKTSDQQLAAAIRQGIGHDGRPLFVMPSATYSRLTDGEVAALIAYMRKVPRAAGATGKVSWGPLGRIGIVQGGLKPQPALMEQYRSNWPHQLGPRHAAGRRIAATMCAGCHQADLSGGPMEDGNVAPNLSVAGAYSFEEFVTLMRTGIGTGGRNLGLMTEIGQKDTRHFTDSEIRALYDYLKARAEKVTA